MLCVADLCVSEMGFSNSGRDALANLVTDGRDERLRGVVGRGDVNDCGEHRERDIDIQRLVIYRQP